MAAPTKPDAPAAPGCTLGLKTVPNAPRDEIVGWLGAALKVRVRAPALEGRANDALLAFLAAQLGLPRRGVTLRHGEKSRQKIVAITGLDLPGVKRRLGL
ncbi:MAG: DUF167 domain-containing protein [Opitutae bacterium]|nr:DUF167 domain-containing protein [Opitutae bacterium]